MVAFRGLLRRKLLAMTSEVAKFFAMAEDILYIARKNQPATQPGDAATWKG